MLSEWIRIPKLDGSERPLGIPTVKDRIVQMATKIAIEPVFEADFRDCSYGFRPKRSAKYNIMDLIVLDFNIESTCYLINNNGDILVLLEKLDFRLGAKWVFANKTLFKETRLDQLHNYNKFFAQKVL